MISQIHTDSYYILANLIINIKLNIIFVAKINNDYYNVRLKQEMCDIETEPQVQK